MVRKLIFSSLLLLGIATIIQAQKIQRAQPTIWVGVSGGANINMFTGTTQTLNPTLKAPAAFHDGFGVGAFGSFLIDYRPNPILGFSLNLGYDNRGGNFDQQISPCNCPEDLNTTLSYATIQPSIRIAPFANDFYVFAGAAYSYNINKSLTYTFDQNNGDQFTSTKTEFSDIRKNVISGLVGIGYDIQLADANSRHQIALSPFISYHPYFGQAPRSFESWSLSTVRVGIALKLGTAKVNEEVKEAALISETKKKEIVPTQIEPANANDLIFSVRAPLTVPVKRKINEAFPLRNYVFFVEGSKEIPKRYVTLNNKQAANFKSEQLVKSEPKDQIGRSKRQMTVYYNILNILGDRMRENPKATITLIGSSAGDGADMGKTYAESVKHYLVDAFGIGASRITTEGRDKPINPSEQPGGEFYLALLRAGDRRVDIISTPDMLTPVQIEATQVDPMDSRIVINVNSKTDVALKSWTLEVQDDKGLIKTYGPYTNEKQSISGNTILGEREEGTYKIVMVGKTIEGNLVRKESSIHLVRNNAPVEDALRFSILFDFDKSNAVDGYEKFISEQVVPHIPNYGKVIIHGHTDIIGSDAYNMNLSQNRAMDTKKMIEVAAFKAGKVGIVYEVLAFGMDEKNAPFENKLPEERFYNRTVIIDIVAPINK